MMNRETTTTTTTTKASQSVCATCIGLHTIIVCWLTSFSSILPCKKNKCDASTVIDHRYYFFFICQAQQINTKMCVYAKTFSDNAIAQWLCFFSAQFFLHTLSLSLDIVVYAEIFMTRVEYRCHFAFIVFFSMSLSAFIIINVPHKHNLILALHVMRMNFVLCCFVIVQIFDNLCWFGLCDRRTYRNVSFKSIIFVWQTWWFAYFLQKIEILLHEENSVHIQNIMNSHPIFGVRCENPKECLFTFNWYLTIF